MKKINLDSVIPDYRENRQIPLSNIWLTNIENYCLNPCIKKVLGIKNFSDLFGLTKADYCIITRCGSEDAFLLEEYFETAFSDTTLNSNDYLKSLTVSDIALLVSGKSSKLGDSYISCRLSNILGILCEKRGMEKDLLSIIDIVIEYKGVDNIKIINYGRRCKTELHNLLCDEFGVDEFGYPKIKRVQDYLARLKEISKENKSIIKKPEIKNDSIITITMDRYHELIKYEKTLEAIVKQLEDLPYLNKD